MLMSRAEFLRSIAGIGIGVAGITTLAACGGDDGGGGDCLVDGTKVTITELHPHAMTVSKEDVEAGVEKTYEMNGSGHTHKFTVTAAMFVTLQGNGTVTGRSAPDTTNHTHAVEISCAG